MTADVKSQEKQLEKDCTRKQSARYKLQSSAPSALLWLQLTTAGFGELDYLCAEYYSREAVICTDNTAHIEAHARQQSQDSIWLQQRHLKLTASNSGKVAKFHDSIVANPLKMGRRSLRQQLLVGSHS